MISSSELSAWLSDDVRQQQSNQVAVGLAARWRAHPLFIGLEESLAGAGGDAEALVAVSERFLDSAEEIGLFLNEHVAAASADPFFRPPQQGVLSDIHTGLLLFDDPGLSIVLGVMGIDALAAKKSASRGPTSIGFTGLLTVFDFVKAGGATLSFWEADEIDKDFTGQQSRKCRFVGKRMLHDGERIVMDGRSQSFVVEHASSDLVYLQAIVRSAAAPLAVEYDSATLDFVGASSTDEASSRTQMMVSLLRIMDRADALPLVEEALKSPHFYTRWHVMREYLAMDAEAALPSLHRLAESDPHPEVRAAARQSLDLFFPAGSGNQNQEPLSCRA
jgi:hypothetical protein